MAETMCVAICFCAHLSSQIGLMFYTTVLVFKALKCKSRTLSETCRARRSIITAAQMRASRALLGIDQRTLADMAGLSLPTIQRMEASEGVIRGNVDSLMKVVTALATAGIELIGDGAVSQRGGRGVRLSAT
jgi:DNA-binding transcriptional regulator YiaG